MVANPNQANNDGDAQDDDNDTVLDTSDNCPLAVNADQANNDGDDNDTVLDAADNCPLIANTDQKDLDGDHIGDVCDIDGNGVNNDSDNCKLTANAAQEDSDSDGAGDACDDDNDTVLDAADNCPLIANTNQADADHDGQGDACDDDVDGDSVANASDACAFTKLNAAVKPAKAARLSALPLRRAERDNWCMEEPRPVCLLRCQKRGELPCRPADHSGGQGCLRPCSQAAARRRTGLRS